MQQRQTEQLGLGDGLVSVRPSFLTEVDALIDWSPVARALEGIYASTKGRPSYPLLMMFKVLLLQQWYKLSDPQTEEALADRISFRQFVRLGLDEPVPDHSTIWRFRQQVGDRLESILAALNAQFEANGLIVKQGSLMDASFVKAVSGKRDVDPDAGRYGHTKDGNITGYKAHVGVDQDSGLVRRLVVTPANVNDTVVADDLVAGDERAVYADKAYDTRKRRRTLRGRGMFVGIMYRPSSHHALHRNQTAFNKTVAKTRAPVERIFAILKQHYGLRRTRYRGLGRTTTHIYMAVMAMNLKRARLLAGP
jgi:IS5 family transposase